jgi:hypothetical protein
MAPGSWRVFDDYLWPRGDGHWPANSGSLAQDSDCVELSFMWGKALCIRRKKSTRGHRDPQSPDDRHPRHALTRHTVDALVRPGQVYSSGFLLEQNALLKFPDRTRDRKGLV